MVGCKKQATPYSKLMNLLYNNVFKTINYSDMIKKLFSTNTDKIFYFSTGLILGLILCYIGFIGFIIGILLGIFLSIMSGSGLIIFIDNFKLGTFKSLNNLKYLNRFDLALIIGTVLLLAFYIFCLFTDSLFLTGLGISGIIGSLIFQRNQ